MQNLLSQQGCLEGKKASGSGMQAQPKQGLSVGTWGWLLVMGKLQHARSD